MGENGNLIYFEMIIALCLGGKSLIRRRLSFSHAKLECVSGVERKTGKIKLYIETIRREIMKTEFNL